MFESNLEMLEHRALSSFYNEMNNRTYISSLCMFIHHSFAEEPVK